MKDTGKRDKRGLIIYEVMCGCGRGPYERTSTQVRRGSAIRECPCFKPYNYKSDDKKDLLLQRTYGITHKEYKSMLKEQDFCCAICGCSFKDQQINVDHNHKTGQVRGLLCNTCNWGLGQFYDNAKLLKAAIKYLGKYSNAR